MPLRLIEDSPGHPQNAVFLAQASDIAYLPPAEAVPAFRDKLGLDAKLISVDNTQCYIAQNDNHVVAAFRGTEAPTSIDGLKDWFLTDAVNLLILPTGRLGTDLAAAGVGARFHQGFVGAIGEIWDPTLGAVQAEMQRAERPLWVTGHSLGGALAVLAGWLFQRKMVSVHQIYTYGGPMVGNNAAGKAIDKEFPDQIFRYVNGPDPVPMLPTMSLMTNDFLHCEKLVGIGEATVGTVDFFKQLMGRAVDGLMNSSLADEVWKLVGGRLDAHAMANYRDLISKKYKL